MFMNVYSAEQTWTMSAFPKNSFVKKVVISFFLKTSIAKKAFIKNILFTNYAFLGDENYSGKFWKGTLS